MHFHTCSLHSTWCHFIYLISRSPSLHQQGDVGHIYNFSCFYSESAATVSFSSLTDHNHRASTTAQSTASVLLSDIQDNNVLNLPVTFSAHMVFPKCYKNLWQAGGGNDGTIKHVTNISYNVYHAWSFDWAYLSISRWQHYLKPWPNQMYEVWALTDVFSITSSVMQINPPFGIVLHLNMKIGMATISFLFASILSLLG